MLSRLIATIRRWILSSRERSAGKVAKDAGARAEELRERGKTGAMF